jgi:hypothetical protein
MQKIELTAHNLCTQTECKVAKFKSARQPTPCFGGIGYEQRALGPELGPVALKSCE